MFEENFKNTSPEKPILRKNILCAKPAAECWGKDVREAVLVHE